MATGELVAEEEALVARASRGDRDAMAALYNRHFDGVYDFVRRMMRDADEAADVVQDVFLKAMTAMGSLKKGERFRPWLFSIAHNTALNRLEKQRRITRPPVGEEEEEESRIYQQVDTDRLADPQAALVDQETASLVWEAAAGLDQRQYALLDLHVRQGLDSAEIAQVIGVSKGNAYTMVSRLKSAVEESVTAYLMVRRGRKECAVLNDILADQEIAGMTPELRRLVNRHVSECPTCQRAKKRIVSPVAILSAFAAVPPPFGLKESIFQSISAAASGPPSGDGGAGSVSGRPDLLAGARAGVERMVTAGREAIGSLPRSRLALLLTGGAIGVGGAVILGMLALFGAFSGDGDSGVLGAVSTPTPTATPRVRARPSAEATLTPTPTPTSTPMATATTTATAASSVSRPPLTATPGPTSAVAGEVTTPTPTPIPPDITGPNITGLSVSQWDIWEGRPLLCGANETVSWISAQVSDPSGIALVQLGWWVEGGTGDDRKGLKPPDTQQGSTVSWQVGPFNNGTITSSQAEANIWIWIYAWDKLGNWSPKVFSITLHNCEGIR